VKEADIKAALIDRLVEKKQVDGDAIIANELVVADRRADIVVANRKLHAFEIKSDSDSLYRLAPQVDVYSQHFNKVTVVCGPKYINAIMSLLDKDIAVWLVQKRNSRIEWKVIRRGRCCQLTDRDKLLSFLPMANAIPLLRSHGVSCSWGIPRAELTHRALKIPLPALRSGVLNYIKDRHADANTKFMEKRNNCNTLVDDLNLLGLFDKPVVNSNSAADRAELIEQMKDYQDIASRHPNAIDISKIPGNTFSKPYHVIPRAR